MVSSQSFILHLMVRSLFAGIVSPQMDSFDMAFDHAADLSLAQ
jgi:hypothetical protein